MSEEDRCQKKMSEEDVRRRCQKKKDVRIKMSEEERCQKDQHFTFLFSFMIHFTFLKDNKKQTKSSSVTPASNKNCRHS
jgi:hypothetical protein